MSNTSFALLSAAMPGSMGRPRLGRRIGRQFGRYYVSARLRRARARTGTSSAGGIAGPIELRRSGGRRQPWPRELRSMLRFRWVLTGLLLLPIAELAVFLAIASEIGTLEALGIMLAGSLAGAAVIRSAGHEARSRFGGNTGGRPLEVAMPGVFTGMAGFWLPVPGFLT